MKILLASATILLALVALVPNASAADPYLVGTCFPVTGGQCYGGMENCESGGTSVGYGFWDIGYCYAYVAVLTTNHTAAVCLDPDFEGTMFSHICSGVGS